MSSVARKKARHHVGFDIIEAKLVQARMEYGAGDVANAAGYAHEMAKMAVNLADEIRYEHGIKAGINRAKAAASERKRKKGKKA